MEKISLKEKGVNIMFALSLTMLVILLNSVFFQYAFPEYMFPKFPDRLLPMQIIVFVCTIPPLIEELVFRFLPLRIFKELSIYENIKWYIVIMSACIFGWMHGTSVNILVQGILGFAAGWVYIKNNNSYWSAVILHALYNFMVMFVVPSLFAH